MCEELGHSWARQVEDLHLSWSPHSCLCNVPAGTQTCGPKPIARSNSLGFVHSRKGKAREDFHFVVLSLVGNPLARSHGHKNAASQTQASCPLVTHCSCLVTSLTTNPGPRAQHQPETSWNSSVSGRICKHRPDLSNALSQQHMRLCMGTVSLLPPCTACCIPSPAGTVSCLASVALHPPLLHRDSSIVSLRMPFSPTHHKIRFTGCLFHYLPLIFSCVLPVPALTC